MRRFFSLDNYGTSTTFHFLLGCLSSYGWASRDGGFWLDTGIEVGDRAISWQVGRNPRRNERFAITASVDTPQRHHLLLADAGGVTTFGRRHHK